MAWDLSDLLISAVRDALGEAVTYTPQGGDAQSITAVYRRGERRAVVADGFSEVQIETSIVLRLSDVTGTVAQGDAVTAGGTNYTVADVQRDTGGGARLVLREA